jgi:TDG/mug DNA glycosylase family protein
VSLDLDAAVDRTVDDLMPTDLRLLFVGINPSLWTAAVNAHFARPGNRFWPALHAAGLTSRPVDASRGMDPVDLRDLHDRGVGITNLVARATRRADELTADELKAGGERLVRLVVERRPRVVAVAGVTAYRTAFGDRRARVGRQAHDLAGAELWVVPNPSGLNAHATLDSLAAAYAEVARSAGVIR